MRSRTIENLKTKLSLNKEQIEILFGVLLGDASLETQNKGRTYRLKIEHSVNQKAYCLHLYDIFKDWILSPPRLRKITLSSGNSYNSIAFSTVSHASFRFYAHQFYKNGKKIVPKLIARWLTAKVLSYWFMDDGSLKSKQSKAVILNTQGYQKKDVIRLIEVLSKKYNLETNLRKQKEGYQIYISGRSYERFKSLVLPHILPEMSYKIPDARRTYLPKV